MLSIYLPRGLPNIYSASLIRPPLPLYLCAATVAHSTSVATVSPYTHRRSLHQCFPGIPVCPPSLLNDILDFASLEMHLEAEIE
jgi:hypothetical protein